MQIKKTVAPIGVFLLWMITSFLCHKLAKTGLDLYNTDVTSLSPILASLVLTSLQLLTCYSSMSMSAMHCPLFFIIVSSHFLATWATNTSLALTFASSTMVIKIMEPMTSALLQSLAFKSALSRDAVVGMVVVVVGAMMFVGQSLFDGGTSRAIFMAVVSNMALGVRNIAIKLSHGYSLEKKQPELYSIHTLTEFVLSVGIFLIVIYTPQIAVMLPSNAGYFIVLCFASGVFHVTYSYVSTNVVLRYMSVVGHAIANIFKRLLVVLLLYMSGRRSASLWNWAGLGVCMLGLFVYNRKKVMTSPMTSSVTSSLSASQEKLTSCGAENESGSTTTTIRRRRLLTGVLGVQVVIFLLCLWPHYPSTLSLHLPHTLESAQKNLLLSQREHKMPVRHGVRSILQKHDSDTLNSSIFSHKNDLVSPVIHCNPPHFGKSEHDYALNLRFGYINYTDGLPLLKDPVKYQPDRKSRKEVDEFLSRKRLIDTPLDTDVLSPYLKETHQVIAEAKRIQENLYSDLFRGKKYAVLFALASFENKGDAALSIGELVLLEKIGIKLIFYVNLRKCHRHFLHVRQAMLVAKKYPQNEVVILMHSGGNIFAKYIVDRCREYVLQISRGYQQVVMPNSIWMRDNMADFKHTVTLYKKYPEMTFLIRDRLSLHIARRLFPDGPRFILSPDIAFQNGPVKRFAWPYYDVMWQRRVDKENAIYAKVPDFPPNVTVHVWDWMKMLSIEAPRSVAKAMNVMQNGFGILQRGKVLVTDRLHGHILSTLLDIPHVLLDNADQKLSAYHNTWTRGLANCRLAQTAEEARRMALELLQKYRNSLPPKLTAADIDENDLTEARAKQEAYRPGV